MGEPWGRPGLPEGAWGYPHGSPGSVRSSGPQMQRHLPREVFLAALDKQTSRRHVPAAEQLRALFGISSNLELLYSFARYLLIKILSPRRREDR